MYLYLSFVFRLMVACILGGVIGYERQNMNRPAGFRTHILVCVGAALVMVTSQFMFLQYKGQAGIDPTRLGAQVISGIGFLGAGTIIREGFSVKGLTTAASLWAVSCVGIAAGTGFYVGAVAATVFIYITLILLKRMEDSFTRKHRHRKIYVQSSNKSGQITAISSVFEKFNVPIRNIEFNSDDIDNSLLIIFSTRLPRLDNSEFIDDLQSIEGVRKVYSE